MSARWTAEDLAATRAGKARLAQPAKASKYHNKRVEFDGFTFDSKKEVARYMTLRTLERAGHLKHLRVHPRFTLSVWDGDHASGPVKIGDYEPDFDYFAAGHLVVEDVKSAPTRLPLYIWKRKHFEAQYGLVVTEV